jgi:hypothetical protein
MVSAFLDAEWGKLPMLWRLGDRRLVDRADLGDPAENNVRMMLLWSIRGPLFEAVPADTEWFEVGLLTAAHFWQLRNIHHKDWSPFSVATNELDEIARNKPRQALLTPPDRWPPCVLWGHDRGGPFTILEGNNRMSALAADAEARQNCALPVIVGLSGQRCGWHRADGVW